MARHKIRRIPEGQEHLPFRNKGRATIMSFATPRERLALFGIAFCFLLSAVVYVYSVTTAVIHVAHIEALTLQSGKMAATVAHLESDYLARSEKVTASLAQSLGYDHVASHAFIERTTTLSLRTSE